MVQDLRHALRTLVRAPVFALVVVVTLALGIGANTAIFSVVNAVILRPLAYPAPGDLVYISSQFPSAGFDQFWISPPEFLELQERSRSFSAIGAFAIAQGNLTTPDRPRRVNGARVSAELLVSLGVPPLIGRWFDLAETRPNGAQVAILSHGIWRSAYGADPGLVGRTVEVNGVPRTVVGVMPPQFDLMDLKIEVWIPLVIDPANRQNRGNHFLYLIGRLNEGTTLQSARAELETLLEGWPASIARGANANQGPHTPTTDAHRLRFEDLQTQVVGSARTAVLVLQGAVVLVLLIACANVASLMLARAESRHREFAVRSALGAGRWHLLRRFVAEGLILSGAGAALGLALSVLGVRALIAAYPDSLPRATEVTLDVRVLGFTLLVAVGSALVFGLAPLFQLAPGAAASALKEGGQRSTAARHRVRRGLVAAEIAFAVALVIGAALLLRSVLNLTRVDSGFARQQLVTFGVSLPAARYTAGPQILSFYDRLLDALRALPGVTGVSAMSGLPPLRDVNANDTRIEGYVAEPGGPGHNVEYYQTIATDYVEAMGIPIVEGRAFVPTDAIGAPVVLINETMAGTFYKGQTPIGRRVQPSGGGSPPWYTIVGVLKDVKQGGVDRKTGTELYFNFPQLANTRPTATPLTMNIVMRTAADAGVLAAPIQAAVSTLDATLPVIRLRSMDEVFEESIGRPRLLAGLLALFAALALTLAAIGSYGVLSYMVTERRREIGIRMALGAGRERVMRMVLSQGLRLTVAGVAGGLAMAFAMNRLLTTLLFGVKPSDPLTISVVVALMTAVAMVGCYLPARLATRVDPMIVLRED